MRYVLTLLAMLQVCMLQAQKYEAKVRELEAHGLPYFYNQDVENNIDLWLKNENNATSDILGREVLYVNHLEYARKLNGLPWFVKFIPAANTGFNNLYVGSDGSTGIWPLEFSIAKKYGLRQNSLVDDRRTLDKSSEAACHYLSDLQFIYKDWLKTVTAFRIGAIRLNQVIRLSGNSLDFNRIYQFLTPEERAPIVQFYAAVTVMYFREQFHIQESVFDMRPMDTVSTEVTLPYGMIETHAGITIADLRAMNPEFKTDAVPFFGTSTYFHIPAERKQAYNAVRDSLFRISTVSQLPVVEYDTIIKVVDSVTYIELRPKGQGPGPDPVKPAEPQRPAPASPQQNAKVWVWYKVKQGDGFYTLSDIFDCTIAEMKAWNGIRNNALIANTTIRFYVPAAKLDYYKQLNFMNQAQKRAIALRD